MKRKVRFIHTADIHLGSLLHIAGSLTEKMDRLVREATLVAFRRICDAAIYYDIDFLIIAGDLYDDKARSVKANHYFIKQCQRLQEKGTQIYIIYGNHDPLRKEGELFRVPDNVHIFGSEKAGCREYITENGVVIANILGQSYRSSAESRKMYSSFNPSNQDTINIGILHTQLDRENNNYVPCSYRDLSSKEGIDYWALGHIHSRNILSQAHPVIAYPGIPQARDFGELGPGGCLLVEMDGKQKTNIQFIPIASLIFRRIEIDLNQTEEPIKNISQLEELIIQRGEELLAQGPDLPENVVDDFHRSNTFEGFAVQWMLTGRNQLHHLLMEQEEETVQLLVNNLQTYFEGRDKILWTDSIRIRTAAPFPDLDLLKENDPIFNEIEEVVSSIEREELTAQLGQIWDEDVDPEKMDEFKYQLDQETLEMIIDQAKELVIEKLLESRDQ